MKIIDIVPMKDQELVDMQGMYMFLTHLALLYPEYAAHASEYKGYKILDNSLIENGGKAIRIEDVLEVAQKINANEVILPDVFKNGSATIAAVDDALKKVEQSGFKGKLMAVIHGKDSGDWFDTFRTLKDYSEIDVLGIPKITAKMHPMGRAYFADAIVGCTRKELHLLGMWYSFCELMDYDNLKEFRSMDTCQLAFLTLNKMKLTSIRPDGFTLDLERTSIDKNLFTEYRHRRNWMLL